MKTTVMLKDSLYRAAKSQAAQSHHTLSGFIEDALREKMLRKKEASRKAEKIQLPTYRGQGLQPGVNLDSHRELIDLMESR